MIRLVTLRLLETYFKHRWLYLLPILLTMLAFFGYVLLSAPVYTADGTLYTQRETLLSELNALRRTGQRWITAADITVDELYELFQSDAFIRVIVQQTDLEEKMSLGPNAVRDTIIEARSAIWARKLLSLIHI